MDLCGLLAALLFFSVGWFVLARLALSTILGRVWLWLYGPERTARARAWVLGGYTLEILLFVALEVHRPLRFWRSDTFGATFEDLLIAALVIVAGLSSVAALWMTLAPTTPLAPREPARRSTDHDAVTATLSGRRALSTIIFSWLLLPLLPIAMPVALLFRNMKPPELKIKLSSHQIEVTSPEKHILWPLYGLSARREIAWDGTPTLTLAREDQEESFFAGGTPPEELDWLLAEIERLSARAPAPREAEPPPELGALRARRAVTEGRT